MTYDPYHFNESHSKGPRKLLVKDDDRLLLLQTNHDTNHFFADYIRDGNMPTVFAATTADQNIVDAITECEEFVTW